MSGNVVRTNHVGFTVDDMGRAIAMFSQLFGYRVASSQSLNTKGVALLTGVAGADIETVRLRHPDLIEIELIAYAEPKATGPIERRPCDPGFTHLTFDVLDIDKMVAAAALHGLAPMGRIVRASQDDPDGVRVVYLRDPDGITIELIQLSRSPSVNGDE